MMYARLSGWIVLLASLPHILACGCAAPTKSSPSHYVKPGAEILPPVGARIGEESDTKWVVTTTRLRYIPPPKRDFPPEPPVPVSRQLGRVNADDVIVVYGEYPLDSAPVLLDGEPLAEGAQIHVPSGKPVVERNAGYLIIHLNQSLAPGRHTLQVRHPRWEKNVVLEVDFVVR